MVGRETFRNLGERVRNAMNIRRGGGDKNLARSGRNPHHARAISASRSTTAWAVAIVVAMIAAVTVMFVPAPAAQADGTTVVDPDTTNAWSNIAASSTDTQNIGRIWTDKSVFDDNYTFSGSIGGQTVSKGDSDFLVGLSALSSTSNLKTTTTTSQPLDIVLVLDDSGSMAYSIDSDTPNQIVYTAVSADQVVESHGHTESGWWGSTSYVQDTRGGEYYVQNDRGGYDRVTEVTETHGGWQGSYEEHIRWTVNGQTVDPETTQFYTRTEYDLSERRGALQYAVNNFIDQAAAMNAQIADENDKIRISIVVFNSNSSIKNHLTVCEGANVNTLKNTVNSLEANGATNAGSGMTNANNELRTNSNREDTKQVVIFFTDGVPTTGNTFSTNVANTAVTQSNQVKDRGGSVYSIGIFDGADPSQTELGRNPNDTDRANVFMNAVSSNYPNPTAWNNLGRRASGDPDFYKSADNAGSLNEVFNDIFNETTENAGSGSPIEEVTHEGAVNPGTLTFTDTLGSYMTVSGDSMTVVYGDQKFTSTNKTTAGNVDTYHFSGTVSGNAVYKEANLADLTVTVARSNDLATGDVVTVQIPASLLPMRNYDVDTDTKTMSVTDAYPIRLFYGVSVKADAKEAIEQGSGDTYDAIVSTNKTDDGKVAFYSNLYNSGSGDTTATFTPSDGNKFYYYTQNTNLYVDQNCTQRATTENINGYNTLYYSEPYWQITSGDSAQEVPHGIAINRGDQDWGKMTTNGQGNYYIPAGTQRLDRPATLNANKTENKTGTATTVLTPSWEGTGVTQRLGNNGKITYDLPGELEIKKSVDWGNASDDTKQNQNSFEFTVNFNGDETLNGNFTYDVYESGEDPVHNGTVADGGTITLKDGQRAVIKGLPTGTTFTVTETNANKNGFTTTDTVTADPTNDTTDGIAKGTIAGGSQQSVSFQNNYKADEPVKLSTKTDLKVKKNLTGRDWRASDEFSFQITQINNGAPTVQMEDPTKVEITQQTDQQTASFGDITFNESGQYRFRVEELSDADHGITPIAGIDYSGAIYRVTVDVADAGQGQLEVTSVLIEQMINDDGGQGSGEVQGDTMAFENRYVVGQASETLQGTKVYENETGSNPIDAGKFSFQLEALGGYETGTVTGEAQPDDYTIAADSDAMPKPAGMTGTTLETGNVGDVFQFPTIYFDGNDVGKTFEYRITELPRQYQGAAEPGMIYDENTSYVVKIGVTEEQDPDSTEPKIVIVAEPSLQPSGITFTNKYEPTAAELKDDDAIHGTKTLEGRQMKEGETFYFQLSALNDNAKTVLTAPETVTVTDQNAMDFAFADMTFTKVGTYTFQVNEVADDKGTETRNADGMTFDTNIATVTVTVTDGNDSDDPADHGKLLASVSYSNDKHSNVTDHAQFTNVYKANMNYGAGGAGGIAVTKTMVDRTMDAGDYNFTLTGTGPDGEITEMFENTAAAANGTVTMKQLQNLTFDEQDAEKTFTFTVDEADPTDENRLPGVEYDQSQYRVDITVHDNHDGNMYTETTVTKIKNADGTEANEIVVDKLNSSTAQGQVPTFGFTNTYKPTEASLDGDTALKVTKKVTGAPSAADYTFTLTAQETPDGSVANIGGLTDGKLTVSTNGVINQDATDNTDDDTQTVSFGKLTFSKPGTYTFTVQEDQPGDDDGWTFGTDVHTVTVVVSDLNANNEYDGALHIKSVTPEDPTLITNSYKADPVIVGGDGAQQKITVQKSVTGADSDAEFTFKIEPVVDDTHTEQWWRDRVKATEGFSPELTISGVTQEQAVTKAFAGIQFNAVGKYTFNVTEVGAADFNDGTDRKGWTYDEHTATVTVTVTDEGNDGQLDAEVSYDNASATTTADQDVDNAAAFTNKYEAGSSTLTGSSTTFNGSKTVTGRDWLDGESFGFTMNPVEQEGVDWSSVTYKADDSSEPVAVGENTATATENGDKTVPFWFPGSYTFTKAGTYTFNVTETQHNSKALPQDDTNGMTYDRHTGVITVTVEDNGEGQLVATPKYEKMTFENKYTPTPVVYGDDVSEILGGNKTVEDHSGSYTMADDQFIFMMRAQNADNPMPEGLHVAQDDQGRPIVSTTNKNTDTQNNKATFDFGEITFTKAGTYQYNIYENETNMPAGVSAQDSGRTYTITFKVTENTATGELTVDASAVLIGSGDQENAPVQLNEINFVNEYDATATSGSTQIFKTLEGRNWQQGDTFTFDVSMTVDGVAADEMPTFNFDNTGTTVNDFKSEAGKLSYNVTITPSTSATGNTYAFSTGTATYTHEGTYVYTITERDVDSSVVNVTKDAAVYTVTVEVKNVNNALQRTVTISRDGQPYTQTGRVDFTNTYTPTASEGVPTDFALQKTFTGHEWTNDYAFEFKLSPVDGAPMPKENPDAGVTIDDEGNAHKTISAPTGDSTDTATFDFGAISYDKAGTYKYKVTEIDGGHGGVTYDTNTVDITVEVKDVSGQLVATATVVGSFTNTYKTSAEYNADGAGGLNITKKVTNHAMTAGQFSFTITATGDNADAAAKKLGIQDGVSTEVKSAAAAAGVAKSVKNNPFETVSFDKSDDGVTYTYTIKENGKTGEGDYKNYVLDDSTYTVQIKPVDNGDGTMTVTTQVSDGAGYTEMTTDQRATVPFVNSYQADPTTVGAEGAATIEGTKTLKNDDIANYTGENAFKFQVKSGDVVVAEGTNDADGNITFGDITYTTENLAAAVNGGSDKVGTATAQTTDAGTVYTFNYTVSEVAHDQSTGVTANTGAQNITVTVTDDGNGKLTPKVTYGTGDSLAFVNTYGGDADYALDITGKKKIVGGQTEPTDVPTLKGDEYEFTITGNAAQDGTPAPMPAKTTVKNDAAGGVTFEDIHYTMENTFGSKPATANADAAADEGIETYTADRTQVFTYTISESGSVAGVTNEQGTKTVTVTVTDLGGGKLKAEVTSDKTDEGADFTFTNVYDVTPNTSSLTGDGGFTITKKLDSTTGRKLAENEFTFQLKSGDTVVAEATNAADGTVSFDGITFTKPGTYNYVLSEVNDGKSGIDYDTTAYNVTATAEDQGDGTLEVTWEMPQAVDGAVTFTNVYDPADATVALGAGKTFAGADLKDGQFTFQLTGADESTPMPEGAKDGVSTATNDENGSVVFDTIAYGKPGTYKYTVSEVNDEQDGVTYDDTTYEVTVTVTDDTATGTLKAAVSYGDADAMVFSNQYKKPVEPAKPTIPKTGIDVIIPGVAGLILLLGAGGVYAFKRRRRS